MSKATFEISVSVQVRVLEYHLHPCYIFQLVLALMMMHGKDATEDNTRGQEGRYPEQAKGAPDRSLVMFIEYDDANDDGVKCNRNRSQVACLRKIGDDIDGDSWVEDQAEKAHGCEEDEEKHVQNLRYGESSGLSGGEEVTKPKNSKLGREAMVLGRENWSGARQ
jgi:hypothetical protein